MSDETKWIKPLQKPQNIQVNASVKVNVEDLEHWSSDQIKAFFTGISAVLEAQAKLQAPPETTSHLIAAAPDLLEACKNAAFIFSGNYPDACDVNEALSKLEFAIRKATGYGL